MKMTSLQLQFAYITNYSRRKVSSVKAYLQQVVLFRAKCCEILKLSNGPEVGKGKHEMWIGDDFIVPQVPPTGLGGKCKSIDLEYFFVLKLDLDGVGNEPIFVTVPITIGTIPLKNPEQIMKSYWLKIRLACVFACLQLQL